MFDRLYYALIYLIFSCLLEGENKEKLRFYLKQVLHRISSYSGNKEFYRGRGRSYEYGTLFDFLPPFFFFFGYYGTTMPPTILIFLFLLLPYEFNDGNYAGGLGLGILTLIKL